MDTTPNSVESLTFLAGFLILFHIIFQRWRSRLPPGPVGVPVLGNLPFLDPNLHTYFTKLGQKYGPITKLQLGQKLNIIINSPSLAREVLKDQGLTFANRDVPHAGRAATYGGYDITWTPYGPEWRMLRKVCTVKMLSNASLDSVYGLRRREVRNAVGRIYRGGGSGVNIGEMGFCTVYNIVMSMVWGGFRGDGAVAGEFREVVSGITELLGVPNWSDFFPLLGCLDVQGIERKMVRLVKKLDGIFEMMIGECLGRGVKKNDFLQFLLDVKDETRDSKTPLTMLQLKALLLDMVIGGTETSSNTIEFAMAEIIKNPKVINKAQQELATVVGETNIVEESHIHNLPYLKSILKETLRLHPVLPLLVPHSPTHTTMVSNYQVPKGSRVLVNVWAIHRDPEHWRNPLDFEPDRFSDAGQFDFVGSDFRFMPFGCGRRNCAGSAMAERMVMYLLATLLHSFDWKLKDGDAVEIEDKFGIVLKMKTPLVAVPTPRLHDSTLYH